MGLGEYNGGNPVFKLGMSRLRCRRYVLNSRTVILRLPCPATHVYHQLDQHPRRDQRRGMHTGADHRCLRRRQRPVLSANLAQMVPACAGRRWKPGGREAVSLGGGRYGQAPFDERLLYGAPHRHLLWISLAQLVGILHLLR